MKLEQNMGIGGQIVGLGKITKAGELVYKDIEPEHNMVVDSGFAVLLQANFDNSCIFDGYLTGYCANGWITGLHSGTSYSNVYYNRRIGAIHYCQYGTGSTETEETDTTLENPVSGYGAPYDGVAGMGGCAYINGTIRNRVTYRFSAASADADIREIGMFTRRVADDRNLSNDYKMFSRVVLTAPYHIMAGEQFVVTYELGIAIPPVAHNLDTGLLDGNTPIKYSRKYVLRSAGTYPGLPNFNWNPGIPHTAVDGNYKIYGQTAYSDTNDILARQTLMPIWWFTQSKVGSTYCIHPAYSLSDKAFPADWANDSGLSLFVTNSVLISVKPYDTTNKSRSCVITLPDIWPNNLAENSSVDIHYLLVNGVAYRFGYYDEGHEGDEDYWHPQAIHKTGTQTLSYTLTQKFERI